MEQDDRPLNHQQKRDKLRSQIFEQAAQLRAHLEAKFDANYPPPNLSNEELSREDKVNMILDHIARRVAYTSIAGKGEPDQTTIRISSTRILADFLDYEGIDPEGYLVPSLTIEEISSKKRSKSPIKVEIERMKKYLSDLNFADTWNDFKATRRSKPVPDFREPTK